MRLDDADSEAMLAIPTSVEEMLKITDLGG
jgi:hypothetical protein